jgi:hypothetical protein
MFHDRFVDTLRYDFLEMLYLQIIVHEAINTTKPSTHYLEEEEKHQ